MTDIPEALKTRATELLNSHVNEHGTAEMEQFATTMLSTLYGENSPQLRQFRDGSEATTKQAVKTGSSRDYAAWEHAHGTIKNALAELEAGLVVKLRAAISGEVLSEMLQLSRDVLGDAGDSPKNVAAVLVAAAYEDLLRRMGELLAGVAGRPPLQDVVIALKDKNVLRGAEVGIAQSFLQFRNDSLHADWTKVSRALVESCPSFLDNMLVKHF